MTNIENMIYEIRGEYVMFDSDLGKLYQCKNGTKEINQAVKRNINRFPNDFYFKLTKTEYDIILRSQIVTANAVNISTNRTLPHVFTEQGVAMLASVLKTDIAADVSVKIMRTFVMLKKYISNSLIEQKYINNMVIKHEDDIKLLQESFSKFEEKRKVNEIYFKGQIYDAYSKILDILKEATNEIIVIDSFLDKSILDMIRDIDVRVILITGNKSKLKEMDIERYNSEYNNLIVKYDDTFHDRYIIIDRKIIYHLGSSINNAGSKTFSINILEDEMVKNLEKLYNMFNFNKLFINISN